MLPITEEDNMIEILVKLIIRANEDVAWEMISFIQHEKKNKEKKKPCTKQIS